MAQPDPDHAATPDIEALEERLEEVADDIAEARRLNAEDDEPKFYESGSIHPELDDQTIAPPG